MEMQSVNFYVTYLTFTILSVSGQSQESIRLATSGCDPAKGSCNSTCEDIAPPSVTLTCEQIFSNSLCDASSIKSGNFCQKSCGTCGTTSQAFLTSQTSPTTCPQYNSKVSIEYNHYDACVTAARNYNLQAKSASAAIACDVARDVENLLRDCKDMATFEAEFTTFSTSQFNQYNDPNEWAILNVGIAFEPYMFEGRTFYSPTIMNPKLEDYTDIFEELSYNYYTDCLSDLGDGCTWYHQGKLRTFYEEEGGAWLTKTEIYNYGNDVLKEGFGTPIIIDGRFYGLVFADVVYFS